MILEQIGHFVLWRTKITQVQVKQYLKKICTKDYFADIGIKLKVLNIWWTIHDSSHIYMVAIHRNSLLYQNKGYSLKDNTI